MLANKSALVLLYKTAHIIYPDVGIYAEQWILKIFLYKNKHKKYCYTSAHIIYPDTGIYDSKHLKYWYKSAPIVSQTLGYMRICETVNIWNVAV